MSARVASPDFVGRQEELGRLLDAARGAAGGSPAVALVGGESGVGKSRLVAELTLRLRDGARILTGDCVDLGDAELAYAPLVGALRGLDRDELVAVLGSAAGGLAPLLSQLEDDAAPGGSITGPPSQGRVFELLLGLLGGLAERAPLVLVVEDIHWADRSTRDFLAFLIRNTRRQRLLVVATYRTDELHRRHPLRPFLAEAERAPLIVRVGLERFTREELAAQLSGILGRRPEPRLVDELFGRAEGNPFFTEELVAAAPDGAGERLPENLRDTLMLRVEALSPAAQAVLRVAAAAGTRVSHGLLERAAGLPQDELLGGLREAVAHQVIVHDPATGAYAFRHALVREALVDDLLPGEGAPLHGALARALEADPSLSVSGRGVAAQLAFHWGAAHDTAAAFAASAQAGADAERVAAFAEANAHFERAAELWQGVPVERRDAGPSLVDLLRRAAEAAHLSGDHDRGAALARRALTVIDAAAEPVVAAVVHERLARYLWVSGYSDEALAALKAAAALLPGHVPSPERARVLGAEGHLLMLLTRPEATARCEEALLVARAVGARAEEGRILTTLGASVCFSGDPSTGIAHLREGKRIAEELGDAEEITRSYVNLGEALDTAGQLDEAAEMAREGMAMARREGLGSGAALLASEYAARLLRLGRWDEADDVLAAALDRSIGGITGGAVLVGRGHLDALRGDFAEAAARLDEGERMQRQVVTSLWTTPLAVARVELELWSGRPAEARETVAAELRAVAPEEQLAFYLNPLLVLGTRAHADLAVRARAVGDADAEQAGRSGAANLLAETRRLLAPEASPAGRAPYEAQLHGLACEAEDARARGEDAAEAWADLAARWEAVGSPYPEAYARWREAEAILAAGGPRVGADAAAARAHALATQLGARPLAAEVEGLARRARLTLDDAAADPADEAATAAPNAAERVGLTARELDVLKLMAAGETNRQIGESLYISQKTVSVHVSRILSKLDARTRVEAAGLALRLGLLDDDTAATDATA